MIKKTLYFSNPAYLSLHLGQLVIKLPEIMNGIITGCVMSFTLSLDDFIISYFTNGPSFQTLPIYIFSLTKKRVKPDMFALSTLMFLVILALLVAMNVAQARAEKKEGSK